MKSVNSFAKKVEIMRAELKRRLALWPDEAFFQGKILLQLDVSEPFGQIGHADNTLLSRFCAYSSMADKGNEVFLELP